ncbi:hypothetical protein KCP74_02730 [Salmonella enterica subsp. enterica]|nr:hypothetical protein KCP74_02730 [Salmonella enterica subsp. enterica]
MLFVGRRAAPPGRDGQHLLFYFLNRKRWLVADDWRSGWRRADVGFVNAITRPPARRIWAEKRDAGGLVYRQCGTSVLRSTAIGYSAVVTLNTPSVRYG